MGKAPVRTQMTQMTQIERRYSRMKTKHTVCVDRRGIRGYLRSVIAPLNNASAC
jgi:hypothetical protein